MCFLEMTILEMTILEMFLFQKFPFLDISMLDVGVRANSKVDFVTYLSNVPSNTIGGMLVVRQCKSQLHSGFLSGPLPSLLQNN